MDEDFDKDTILGNRYRLIHQVGKGGMALVFEAYDQMLERPVAIKILKHDFSQNSLFRERFLQEAKAAANLSHPNIVTVYDFGMDLSAIYFVMELVPGTDLKTKINELGRFDISPGVNLLIQSSAGLGYAHRAGIVHCDVKPHNLLISPDNRLKITDFGISRALSAIAPLERSDVVWGSPQYFAPEQALGEAPTPASDVYSLGVVMYEMFTGHLPFEAANVDELIKLHQTQMPLSPRKLNPDIPQDLDAIILKVLAKEPSARYRTADQLGRVLKTFFEQPDNQFTSSSTLAESSESQRTIRTTPPSRVTPEDYSQPVKSAIDWKLIGLELFTLLVVGGLVPFWLYVFFKISPLLR